MMIMLHGGVCLTIMANMMENKNAQCNVSFDGLQPFLNKGDTNRYRGRAMLESNLRSTTNHPMYEGIKNWRLVY